MPAKKADVKVKVLYYSVHAVLEYDELLLLHSLGHEVFSLGLYFDHDPSGPPRPDLHIRPRPPFRTDPDLVARFKETGGYRAYPNSTNNTYVSAEFLREFDVFIVMHDAQFIAENWETLRVIPIVWRTIGQNLDLFEPIVRGPAKDGLKIVRYSPFEENCPEYVGHDAQIRFYRDESLYGPWNGSRKAVIHYTTSFAYRYPAEYALFEETLQGIDYALGSGGNEGNPHAFGQNSFEEQRKTLRDYGAYFYCCAFHIPYNLAYVEALMSGTPMVVYHDPEGSALSRRYFEAPFLIEDGVSGLLVRSPAEGREALLHLLSDEALAGMISANGRGRAIKLFSKEVASRNWMEFLSTI